MLNIPGSSYQFLIIFVCLNVVRHLRFRTSEWFQKAGVLNIPRFSFPFLCV